MKHGYWGTRGAGQIGRLLLAYCGFEWEEVKYVEREKWFDEDKKNLGFDFPNLPYLIDGDFKLTETKAIQNYVIKKSGKTDLLGKNLQDEAIVMELAGVFEDAFSSFLPLFWNPEYEKGLPAAIEKMNAKLELANKFIGEKPFALGYLTIIDFRIAEISHYIKKLAPESYAKYGFIKTIHDNFNELPEIKAYYAKETSVKGPFLPPVAAIQV